MEPSLNLLGLMPLVLMAGLTLVAVGALVAGVRARARAGVATEDAGIPNWQLVLFAAVVAFLFLQVVTYVLAFAI